MDNLDVVKTYLRIDGDTDDAYLLMLMEEGMAFLNGKVGGNELDFEEEGAAKRLLLSYVRYAYNDATEFFTQNFAEDILTLQLQHAVMMRKEGD